jgi:hypothetical protein
MATSRWALPYPTLDDQPNGPDLGEDLADAVDAALSRGRPLTTTQRLALIGTPEGYLVWDTDLAALCAWNGSTWVVYGTGGGGGGGGSGGGGRWSASGTGQLIPNTTSGPGTPVAFGDPSSLGGAPTQVTRTNHPSGTGHVFELLDSGVWACGTTIRVASSSVAGEVSAGIWADPDGGTDYDLNIAHDGGRREGLPRTLSPNRSTYLPSGSKVVVLVYNGTGSQRQLEPAGGAWVNLDLRLVG